jgi:hypothetical protein
MQRDNIDRGDSDLSLEVRKSLIAAISEYLLITAPILIYVSLEAWNSSQLEDFAASPEWSMATVFLAFQGSSLYRKHLALTGRQLSEPWLDLLRLSATIITFAASINIYISLRCNSMSAIIFRLVLFGVSSVFFLVFVAGGKLASLRRRA